MNKILVLGAFGFIEEHFDGQTIKTRNLLTLLQQNGVNPDFFEAQRFKHNKLSVLSMFWKVRKCDVLFYLPAQNNLRYLFPLIYIVARISNVKIHYFVVGGWLKEFIENKHGLKKKLSKINGIHCETQLMKGQLEREYGFKNVDVFPNFRISDFKSTAHHEDGKLKLVFMARVVKMKGIDTVFSLCEKIRNAGLGNRISIDFYGPQQDHDNDKDGSIEFFNNNIKKYEFASYHGAANPADVNGILEKYDVMLLPTHYYTEGFPGSILDAYISGIPVIVTKWKHATEFVDDGETGIIIPFEDDGTALANAVMRFYKDNDLLNEMKLKANAKWHDFSSEKAWELLQNYK